jgi:hypothetical protein
MGLQEDLIKMGLSKLKKETNLKKIYRLRMGLIEAGLTEEEIDSRLDELENVVKKPTPIDDVQKNTRSPEEKGYKEHNFNSGSQMYILACAHQIRARKVVGLFSRGMLGKIVWCDICKSDREVTAMPYWVQ